MHPASTRGIGTKPALACVEPSNLTIATAFHCSGLPLLSAWRAANTDVLDVAVGLMLGVATTGVGETGGCACVGPQATAATTMSRISRRVNLPPATGRPRSRTGRM